MNDTERCLARRLRNADLDIKLAVLVVGCILATVLLGVLGRLSGPPSTGGGPSGGSSPAHRIDRHIPVN